MRRQLVIVGGELLSTVGTAVGLRAARVRSIFRQFLSMGVPVWAVASIVVGLMMAFPAQAVDVDEATCLPTWPHASAADHVVTISNGWRSLERSYGWNKVNEQRNVRVILREFRKAGFSNALAYAAIVNAMAESALDHTAVMSTPFRWKNKFYPRGTRAVGLFQLLPSVSGAGGPSGYAEGYPRNFMGRRYAGTAWQAKHHGSVPDWQGRTYYNGQDPAINTRRIILEVRRDGANVLAAERHGASIAKLTYLFARDIERPSVNVWKRQHQAAQMLGAELAYREHPNLMFPLEFTVPDPPPPPLESCPQEPEIDTAPRLSSVWPVGLLALALFGLFRVRTRDDSDALLGS